MCNATRSVGHACDAKTGIGILSMPVGWAVRALAACGIERGGSRGTGKVLSLSGDGGAPHVDDGDGDGRTLIGSIALLMLASWLWW